MTPDHSYFELLSALADSRELTESEIEELCQHSELRASCRERITETTQIRLQLLLASALDPPKGRLPKGMRERFIARAFREGVPLSERSSSVGIGAVGLASAALVVLLAVAAVLNRAPSLKPIVQYHQAELSRACKDIYPDLAISRASAGSRLPNTGRIAAGTHRVNPSHSHHQAPSTRPIEQSSAFSTAVAFTDAIEPSQHPRRVFPAPREFISEPTPNLLAASLHFPLAPLSFQSNLASSPATRLLYQASDLNASGITLKPEFKVDPATFQLAGTVIR
ncbi:MAG TPA: hypothetical protein VE178_21605 [Silvibacterium sp.]|nr:hypothetical protein [Silvibacterium sp.]